MFFLQSITCNCVVLLEGDFSSSGSLGKAALFYCSTSCVMHIIIMLMTRLIVWPGRDTKCELKDIFRCFSIKSYLSKGKQF